MIIAIGPRIPETNRLKNTHNIDAHMHNLGQKYMGIRPEKHQDLFHDTSFNPAAGHDVLVDNFLNAQCKMPPQRNFML
jgi:saccharopepsin